MSAANTTITVTTGDAVAARPQNAGLRGAAVSSVSGASGTDPSTSAAGSPAGGSGSPAGSCARDRPDGRFCRGRSARPSTARIAGSSVTATARAHSTAAAAPIPMTVRKGIPATARPSSAIMTVRPANTTAVPAVELATATDSRTATPAASCVR